VKEMTAEERRAFLAHGTRTGKLATVRADGSPHAAPVWFVLDGDELVFKTWHESVKACGTERGRGRARCARRAAPCRRSSRDGHLANALKAAVTALGAPPKLPQGDA
jgi:hypothetical protein